MHCIHIMSLYLVLKSNLVFQIWLGRKRHEHYGMGLQGLIDFADI